MLSIPRPAGSTPYNHSGTTTPTSSYGGSYTGSGSASEDELNDGYQDGSSRVDVEHLETCRIRRRYLKLRSRSEEVSGRGPTDGEVTGVEY